MQNRTDETADAPVRRSLRYLRVSSKKQMDTDADIDPEGNSIDTQRKVCQERERELGLVNIDEYVEPGNSAQTIEKRPVFQEMLKRIARDRDVDCVIIYMRSRAFRNFTDAAITKRQLLKYGVKLISAKEDFGEGMMADAMEAVTDIINELQVRMSSEDIKVKMANKARNGGTIGRAKLGYLNEKVLVDGRKVNTVAVDPERSEYVLMAFELMATGQETYASICKKLTEAGLVMPMTGKYPGGSISAEKLRLMLRDRYYLGIVTYKGVEYPGRHQPLISEELFERVQQVTARLSEGHTRMRTHHHYLKGLLACGRCKKQLVVQRARGRRGGEYYYFFCIGRQKGTCDLPYIPVEVLEEGVVRHYGDAVLLPETIRARIRAGVDDAVTDNYQLTATMREQYTKRLDALDNKESYFLDLAAEEGWPKDKLRTKIDAIRRERKEIRATLDQAESQMDTGRQVFRDALTLLEDPQAMYERGNETVRSILNKAFFTKLYVDGSKVVDHLLHEPFDIITDAYRRYRAGQAGTTYYRRDVTSNHAALTGEYGVVGAVYRDTLIDSLSLTLAGQGSSKPVMVDLRRLETAAVVPHVEQYGLLDPRKREPGL